MTKAVEKANNPAKKYNPHPKTVLAAQRALVLAGGNMAEAARNSGISAVTFKRYKAHGLIDPSISLDGEDKLEALDKLSADRNSELAELMMDTVSMAVDQTRAELADASAKEAAGIASTMLQNSHLLQGKATSNVRVDVSGQFEVLKRHGLIVEAPGEVIDAVVEDEDEDD